MIRTNAWLSNLGDVSVISQTVRFSAHFGVQVEQAKVVKGGVFSFLGSSVTDSRRRLASGTSGKENFAAYGSFNYNSRVPTVLFSCLAVEIICLTGQK